jgi:hypothetical protein
MNRVIKGSLFENFSLIENREIKGEIEIPNPNTKSK